MPDGQPVVHLERSRTSRAFEGLESLWADELDQIYGLIDKHVAALEAEPERRDDEQSSRDKAPLLSIAIFGTSGSGKTSLLKTLVSEVNSHRYAERMQRSSRKSHLLRALPIIEPNILANDEHFLYAFLAAALDEDLKKRISQQSANALTPLQQEFQNVSEYLQVVDKIEKLVEYDPLRFSLERLERHSSGFQLRQKMWALLDRLADELAGKNRSSIVLLPVDDADMAFDSLISTLDTFHRYLLHPRLVPVFTFTSRLAEELLRVHFAQSLTVAESKKLSEGNDRVQSTLQMVEQMAVQYMVKLFPIRNRIRLGPAPARVQAADYRTQSDQTTSEKVWTLLEAASILLFGDPEWPIAPRLRLALRPSTLRRQLQVLDAMHDSRVSALLQEPGSTQPLDRKMSWVSIFKDAAWALLNVHRDVLRDFKMHVEDLYSLTPHNLSREVLGNILSLEWEIRRELIQRWRFQVEDRRGQILSLLALNAFRPQMPGEEPSGDDPDAVSAWSSSIALQDKDMLSFSAVKGLLWFLDLWIGFYLPQILARNRLTHIPDDRPEAGGIRSVGWNLRSGPANAVQEAIDNHEISATGMMLLLPEDFEKALGNVKAHLALHVWCFYGYKKGKAWTAVSFWRGLGLIGLLLEDHERLQVAPDWRDRNDQVARVRAVIEKHCETAKIPGSFQEGTQRLGRWDPNHEGTTAALEKLSQDIVSWLQGSEKRIFPLQTLRHRENKGMAFFQEAFGKSFIRRLHGEYLLGELWPELGGAYIEGPPIQNDADDWDAGAALCKWTEVLTRYWNTENRDNEQGELPEQLPILGMLLSCPLLKPFLSVSGEAAATKTFFESLKRTNRENVPWETKDGNHG